MTDICNTCVNYYEANISECVDCLKKGRTPGKLPANYKKTTDYVDCYKFPCVNKKCLPDCNEYIPFDVWLNNRYEAREKQFQINPPQ